MALHLHRAERTDALADGLGELLAVPQPDPFAEELILVPARGVERWLSQRLSHVLGRGDDFDGVCAGVKFRSPASLVAELTGVGRGSEADRWSPGPMTWPLLEVIDSSLGEPWLATLASHLGHFATNSEKELRQGRRYAVARRLAGLFASYARQRPQLLVDWLDGGSGGVDDDLEWQAHLWRALVETVGIDPPHVRHAKAVDSLRNNATDLPSRISLFGHTRLPATDIELLGALATHHDLHLWLPHPSAALWSELNGMRGVLPRHADTSHRLVDHPLLATLGRDLRELQRSLPHEVATDEFLPGGDEPRDTLLGWLVSDVAANAVRPAGRTLAAGDRSVQVHSCHGAARQVDVLREVLLGLLADDPTLEPRDILVMCPDIEAYAPLVVSAFGLGDVGLSRGVLRGGVSGEGAPGSHPAHRLRMRLADRSLVQTNPLLAVAAKLLALAGSRATATEVLDLAHAAPVRARFRFTDDDLEDITRWVEQANIRWGFDQGHRRPYGVDFIQNTWRFGIDRVLAGVAMSDDSQSWLGVTLPLDDVGSNRVELAGRLAEFVDRLRQAVESLDGTLPLDQWLSRIADAVEALTAVGGDDLWQVGQLRQEFSDVVEEADSRSATILRLPDVRALLDGRLAGRPTRANFRTGSLTVCTMVPMRSVPHRVVCLVGLDDTVFPRLGAPDGDDVLAREPMTGERDIRSEDRQLLLDAICAATDKLVITYAGTNEHSGQQRPPAVPLMELLDALDATVARTETGTGVRDQVLIKHPLQPFDIRNVTPGALGEPGKPFTFDPLVIEAARISVRPRAEQPDFLARPLPPLPPDDITLAELQKFFADPVKGFFNALNLALPREIQGIDDAIPVEIDALQQWTVGQRMLTDLMAGMSSEWAVGAEWRRGALPPGWLGWRQAGEFLLQATRLADVASAHRKGSPSVHEIDLVISGRRLTGVVSPVHSGRLVDVTYSKLGGQHLLKAWIPLLSLAVQLPDHPWGAVCVGRFPGRRPGTAERLLVAPHDDGGQAAREILEDLLAIYDAGRREPLPLPIKTSYAWAKARMDAHSSRPPDPAKDAAYQWKYEKEGAAVERVWGKGAALDCLLAPVKPGEEVAGEATRLGAYASRLWTPLLRATGGLG